MIRELRLADMVRSLLDANVEFLVFGAVAAALYGHIRATRDLDIVLAPDPDNVERLIRWLHEGRTARTLGSRADRRDDTARR